MMLAWGRLLWESACGARIDSARPQQQASEHIRVAINTQKMDSVTSPDATASSDVSASSDAQASLVESLILAQDQRWRRA